METCRILGLLLTSEVYDFAKFVGIYSYVGVQNPDMVVLVFEFLKYKL